MRRTTLVLLSLLALAAAASAETVGYANEIPNGNSIPDPNGCETPQSDSFESDLQAAGGWTLDLCLADSDDDGLYNGEELGDPLCSSVAPAGGNPDFTLALYNTAVSHPGKKDDGTCTGPLQGADMASTCCPLDAQFLTLTYSEAVASYPEIIQDGVIPCGLHIVIDVPNVQFEHLLVRGKLTFNEGTDIKVRAKGVLVCGELSAGTSQAPRQSKLTFELYGSKALNWKGSSHNQKAFVVQGGKLDMHGSDCGETVWTQLSEHAYSGDSIVHLQEQITCEEGDQLIVTSTDFNSAQSEVVTCGAVEPPASTVDDEPGDYAFIRALSNVDEFVDIGKDAFNTIFQQSAYHIIKRECPSCDDSHKEIFYKRKTMLDTFEPYTYMAWQWRDDDNEMGIDFDLYSTLEDALAETNAWQYCNYGKSSKPFGGFKHCGPTENTKGQWVSIPVEGATNHLGATEMAAFYIVDSLDSPYAPSTAFPPPQSPPPLPATPFVKLSTPLVHPHNGQGLMQAQVGRLSRNIVIKGVDGCEVFDDNADPQVGKPKCGHFMFFHTNHGTVCGVEITQMGRHTQTGRYPLHAHMCGWSPQLIFSSNSLHHNVHRGVVIHGTHNVTIANNVGYRTFGHMFMTEDGSEMFNRFESNLGVSAFNVENPSWADRCESLGVTMDTDTCSHKCGFGIGPDANNCGGRGDDQASIFWMGNLHSYMVGNVAVGGGRNNFRFEIEQHVVGTSLLVPEVVAMAEGTALGRDLEEHCLACGDDLFRSNIAHSAERGLSLYAPSFRPSISRQLDPSNNVSFPFLVKDFLAYKHDTGTFTRSTRGVQLLDTVLLDNTAQLHWGDSDLHGILSNVDFIPEAPREEDISYLSCTVATDSACNIYESMEANRRCSAGLGIYCEKSHGLTENGVLLDSAVTHVPDGETSCRLASDGLARTTAMREREAVKYANELFDYDPSMKFIMDEATQASIRRNYGMDGMVSGEGYRLTPGHHCLPMDGALCETVNAYANPTRVVTWKASTYTVYSMPMTWYESRTFCESRGGHLAVVSDAYEQAFLSTLVQELGSSVWLGLTASPSRYTGDGSSPTSSAELASMFEWVTGESPQDSFWCKYQPDHCESHQFLYGLSGCDLQSFDPYQDSSCAAMTYQSPFEMDRPRVANSKYGYGPAGCWADYLCHDDNHETEGLAFICEAPASEPKPILSSNAAPQVQYGEQNEVPPYIFPPYAEHAQSEYLFSAEKMGFCEAIGFCGSKGGWPVVIDSDSELETVKQALAAQAALDSSYDSIWVGLYDLQFANQFDWLKPSSYAVETLPWASAPASEFPFPTSDDDCDSVFLTLSGKFTLSTSCGKSEYVLCEVDASAVSASSYTQASVQWAPGIESTPLTVSVGTELQFVLEVPSSVKEVSKEQYDNCGVSGGSTVVSGSIGAIGSVRFDVPKTHYFINAYSNGFGCQTQGMRLMVHVEDVAPASGTCEGHCHLPFIRADTGCYCDPGCVAVGDCCEDYTSQCAPREELSLLATCESHCGERTEACSCDDLCTMALDCCADFTIECGAVQASAMLPEAMVETGVLTLERGQLITVTLEKGFTSPVIFISPVSNAEEPPMAVLMKNLRNGGDCSGWCFDVVLEPLSCFEEPPPVQGRTTVVYYRTQFTALEKGVSLLPSGDVLQVGTANSIGWETLQGLDSFSPSSISDFGLVGQEERFLELNFNMLDGSFEVPFETRFLDTEMGDDAHETAADIVVVSMLQTSNNFDSDGHLMVPRILSKQSYGFRIILQSDASEDAEESYKDNQFSEEIGYVALRRGAYELDPETIVYAGVHPTVNHEAGNVHNFGGAPGTNAYTELALMASVSCKNDDFALLSVLQVNATHLEARVQEEECKTTVHPYEDVNFLLTYRTSTPPEFHTSQICSGPAPEPVDTLSPPPSPPPPPPPTDPQPSYTLPQTATACCEDLLPTFEFKSFGATQSPQMCGSSLEPDCFDVTWEEAYDICQAQGAALCDVATLPAAFGTGCQFNKQKTWTQTPCVQDDGSPGFIKAVTKKFEASNLVCAKPSAKNPVRCCADACA